MTPELIQEINAECPSDQGIFVEPFGIPVTIKEPVIYTRWISSGISGGSCWGTEHESFKNDIPENRFKVLDIVLEKLNPSITYLQYKKIDALWDNTEFSEKLYYGNHADYTVKFMLLSKLEEYLKTI